MTTQELSAKVWELIDEHSMEFEKTEWVEFLNELISDATFKREATEEELEEES